MAYEMIKLFEPGDKVKLAPNAYGRITDELGGDEFTVEEVVSSGSECTCGERYQDVPHNRQKCNWFNRNPQDLKLAGKGGEYNGANFRKVKADAPGD